jgi:integrase
MLSAIISSCPQNLGDGGNMRLSEVKCRNSKQSLKPIKLFDGGGLYLEIMPSGGKLWRLIYRYGGKEKRLSIGPYPLISLQEAGEKREEAKKQLMNHIDPSLAKQESKEKAFADNNNTFEIIAREWHTNVKGKWSVGHAHTVLTRMENHLFPRIGKMPIRSITPSILLNALKDVESCGVFETTKRAKQYAGQVFRYAIITDRVDRDSSIGLNGILTQPKVKHNACLDVKELPELFEKLASNNARLFIQTRYAIELMILTFVRTSELLEAKWSEFDLEGKTWHIPGERMKMRKAHLVPLASQTIEILEKLRKLDLQSAYILPSPLSHRIPLSGNTILSALYKMGYKGKTTGHGFRALAMTAIKEKLGYRHEVVDRQLAHAHRNSIDAAYDRAQFLDERIKMMQEWAD